MTPCENKGDRRNTLPRIGALLQTVPALFALAWITGCSTPVFQDVAFTPPYKPNNVFLYVPGLAPDVKRVAVLPLACEDKRIDLVDGCESLSTVLQSELIKTKKFEIVTVSRDLLRDRTGRPTWTGAEMLPPELFESLRQLYGCDAILFCQLTTFRPYAPLAVGWRLRLVDARTRQTLWATDEVFDAGARSVIHGATEYQSVDLRLPDAKPENWAVLNSPRQFAQYSAAQLLATLPSR